MLDTKLILVDGIPGSGKSTTAQWIALELQRRQIEADWFMDEHRGNPVTIWEHLPAESFLVRSLENWQQLTRTLQSSNQIMVLEGCFFQQLLGGLFAQDMERAKIIAGMQAVYERIRALQPVLIYFYQADLELALKTIHTERGAEWSEYMLKGLEQTPYATRRHLTGFDALIQYNREYRALTDELLQSLGLRTLAIENAKRDWPVIQDQIRQFLRLSPLIEEPVNIDELARFEGRYRDLSGTHPHNPECTIRMGSRGLVLYDFRYPKSDLILKAADEFYVQTLGYQLTFETDRKGKIRMMKVGGKEPAVGIGTATLLGREFHRVGNA